MIKMEVDIIPPSVNHAYRHTRFGIFMTSKGKKFKKAMQDKIMRMKMKDKSIPYKGKVKVDIQICFGDKRKRDLDNSNKLILDSLQKGLFVDDCQIDDLHIRRLLGKEKLIKIEVEEIR
jgi:crossover junction endodeoxyribonuclease RusA